MTGDVRSSGSDALSGGQDGGGGLGARIAARPVCGVEKACPAVTPYRAQTMKATESASALRTPGQPEVVAPGG